MKYKGHIFNRSHNNRSEDFKYYTCKTCGIVVFQYGNSLKLEVSKDYNIQYINSLNYHIDLLTCNEIIIKNLIE